MHPAVVEAYLGVGSGAGGGRALFAPGAVAGSV